MRKWFLAILLGAVLSGCGGSNTAEPTASGVASGSGQFNVTVSGAMQSTFSGNAVYLRSDTDEVSDINISLNSVDNTQTVNISVPSGIATGTYTIDPNAAIVPIMSYASFVMQDENIGAVAVYSGIQGTLTLESIDPMTGRFEFTGQSIEGDEVGVNGTFTGLPRGEYPTPEAEE